MSSFYRFPVETYQKFGRDYGGFLAALLSYYALFSIFPLLLLIISAAGYFVAYTKGAENAILAQARALVPQFGDVVRDNVADIISSRGRIGVFGLLMLLWAGTGVFDALEYSLDRVWAVAEPRHVVVSKLLGIGAVVVLTSMLLLFTLGSLALQAAQIYWLVSLEKSLLELPFFWNVVVWLAGVGLMFLILMAIYVVVPNRRFALWEVWPGALFAAVAWDLARRLFGWYAAGVASYNAVYGSVGVIIGLMIWLYIAGLILIMGAEVNAVRDTWRSDK